MLINHDAFNDGFTFSIKSVVMTDNVNEYGYGSRGAKVKIDGYLGEQVFEPFSLDIVSERHITDSVEHLEISPVIDHDSLQNLPPIPVVPIENHLADKICAMYERSGEKNSTRWRDPADIVRIVQHLSFKATELNEKLAHETQRRKMTLPTSIISPGPLWENNYASSARQFAGFPQKFHALEASLEYAGACLNPILSGTQTTGTWQPDQQRWDNISHPRMSIQ